MRRLKLEITSNMKRFILFFAVITIVAASIAGQEVSKADLKQLDEYYSNMVDDWDIPSVSIGIVKDGKMIFPGRTRGHPRLRDAAPRVG